MRDFYEKYKVWMPWSWVSVASFMAAMYLAKAWFNVQNTLVESFRPVRGRRAVAGQQDVVASASSIAFGKSGAIEVQVFGKHATADEAEVKEARGQQM